MDNPLPASTGRVCQHPCESRCRRQSVDEPINMREVHRVIADAILLSDQFDTAAAKVVARRRARTGRKVTIVGAGPPGLTAAFYLALLGHDVVVHESHAEPGGMLRFALPAYRLPRDVLDREIEIIRRLGVQFIFNSAVGTDIPLADLETTSDAVFLSLGTWKESQVRVRGGELAGVYGSLHFLEAEAHGRQTVLGEWVVIIGGGNSAIDCARTVIRKGLSATVIYRRERKDMPAIAEEVEAAEEEGVAFIFLASPHRIVGERNAVKAIEMTRTRLGAFDTSGRRRPVDTGEVQVVGCDSVILAVGETVDRDFSLASGLATKASGMLEVDRYALTTSREGVFAGGDFVGGASNVFTAMSYGKSAARSIDSHLTGEARFDDIFPAFEYDQTPPQPSPCGRHHAHFCRPPSAPGRSGRRLRPCDPKRRMRRHPAASAAISVKQSRTPCRAGREPTSCLSKSRFASTVSSAPRRKARRFSRSLAPTAMPSRRCATSKA
jgi:NADH-quinone oxidoreductase subunit F